MKVLFFAMAIFAVMGSQAQHSRDMERLSRWMEGSFSSREQHQLDSTHFNDLRLKIVRIWPDRVDGIWYYVEQAVAGNEAHPYRQRIYHLIQRSSGIFQSDVLTMHNPLRFAGQADSCQARLHPDSLQLRNGCSFVLRKENRKKYVGGTEGKSCPSELKGAQYASSKVIVFRREIRSLEQGFDSFDMQVWGSERGPYKFLKL